MSRHAASVIALLLAAVYLAACGGCGPRRPATAPVKGLVTYQGKPVVTGRIMFYPEAGRPAIGAIGPDGSYQLTAYPDKPGAGALPGRYRVTVEAIRGTGGAQPKSMEEEMRGGRSAPAAVEWLVPKQYSSLETSPLTAEVKPGANTINFDLLDKP